MMIGHLGQHVWKFFILIGVGLSSTTRSHSATQPLQCIYLYRYIYSLLLPIGVKFCLVLIVLICFAFMCIKLQKKNYWFALTTTRASGPKFCQQNILQYLLLWLANKVLNAKYYLQVTSKLCYRNFLMFQYFGRQKCVC